MTIPKTVLTLVTVAIGATPAIASGATSWPEGGACRIALNHNEVLVAPLAT